MNRWPRLSSGVESRILSPGTNEDLPCRKGEARQIWLMLKILTLAGGVVNHMDQMVRVVGAQFSLLKISRGLYQEKLDETDSILI
ncbi:hypothetical protein TNCV_1969861 [Trichonephila clavipes]|nr:hypothetical protein TNCV_1969861 [Trichonephila clavipes]